jgi:hypothetical protein
VRNVAVLEGMVDHLRSIKVAGVGLYSSASHWRAIAGTSVSADCVLLARGAIRRIAISSGQTIIPRRKPVATASARSLAPSLRNSRRAWVLMVSSDR